MTSNKNSLSEKIVLYRCVTAEKQKETRLILALFQEDI
jgi:hypothetical protein